MRTDMVLRAPVDVAERLDDVLARLRLVVGRHRVLEIEEDHVGRRLGGLLEQLRLAAGNGQLAAVEPGGRLFDDGEAHVIPVRFQQSFVRWTSIRRLSMQRCPLSRACVSALPDSG